MEATRNSGPVADCCRHCSIGPTQKHSRVSNNRRKGASGPAGKKLELKNCTFMKVISKNFAFALSALPNLVVLNCSGCKFFSEKKWALSNAIVAGAPNITHLTVDGFEQAIDLSVLGELKFLSSLSIASFWEKMKRPEDWQVWQDSFQSIWPHISSLNLTYTQPDGGLQPDFFTHLSKLRSLSLYGHGALADRTCAAIANCCPELERLDIGQCTRVSDTGLTKLATLHHLKWLNLYQCTRLTDSAVQHLASRCRKLEHLSVYGLDKMTVQGMLSVLEFCPNMGSLDMGGCKKITGDGRGQVEKVLELR
eukprot:CAMPEP_0175125582 /NCGR_PEP_ID=MMETSP0087-20121206/3391_1 /TAXON_ID=136419 /ORGANISM="Unknown Unknown, Strain D1" /LENGTH=307 /DNA_ID=CAMNT_0016407425 /DNA_START=17 /DNA_END=940 /DNA_ORIENTATION=+